jgi:hypothetical protein
MKLLSLLFPLSMGMYFHMPPGHKKCIKEEIHKDVVVTGEFEAKESPGHRVINSVLSKLSRISSGGSESY